MLWSRRQPDPQQSPNKKRRVLKDGPRLRGRLGTVGDSGDVQFNKGGLTRFVSSVLLIEPLPPGRRVEKSFAMGVGVRWGRQTWLWNRPGGPHRDASLVVANPPFRS